jgi:hypothetical protein
MIQRRARAVDVTTKIGNHTFRATGVTAYLKNGGTLEKAAQRAARLSTSPAENKLGNNRRVDLGLGLSKLDPRVKGAGFQTQCT